MSKHQKLIEIITTCSDSLKLRNWIKNAHREGAVGVEEAARRRLIEVEASKYIDDTSDPLVVEFWKSISALELALSEEKGKTIRLARTRQKITRVGVQKTLNDLALQVKPSEGYFLLRDRGMLDLSAEAVILRFPDRFDENVCNAARSRLDAEDSQSSN